MKIDSGFDFEAVAGKTVLRRAICKYGKKSKTTLRQLENGATTSKIERTGEWGLEAETGCRDVELRATGSMGMRLWEIWGQDRGCQTERPSMAT